MTAFVECSFFVPITRDKDLSDGRPQSVDAFEWLTRELFVRFSGATIAPGFYEGFYQDPDTGQQVPDRSKKYIVAIAEHKTDELRELLKLACGIFEQKCIYLSIAGEVVRREAHNLGTCKASGLVWN